MEEMSKLKLFTGSAHVELAEEIAKACGTSLAESSLVVFSDGEKSVRIDESVRGCDAFIIQPTCSPTAENLMEVLIYIDALRRASARSITAVIPYFGYARQDRKSKARDPITAKLVANLFTVAGADRVLTMDLHARQIQGFFDIPVDNLEANNILAEYFVSLGFKGRDDIVVVSPDNGGITRARHLAVALNAPLAIIDKRRPRANEMEVMNVIGEIEGKIAVMTDDIIDTAGTITRGAEALMKMGAREVYAGCVHPILSGPAVDRIAASVLKELVVTNTVPLAKQARALDNIKVLSVGDLFSKAIKRIYEHRSVSELFNLD
ncbi:ribose-phosphate pyrophosphokinase [Clostridium sp. 'deep sea']|uniref:ribose-phosphate diphosphokinase n=1 Tax=Clostridium sp. 'deep sea' TaxID=2779445 RepID=UPI002434153D|nr:ribose-phosphate pyrophosphokinase [Clostridium sp. 'deep sea']